jgi:hypothetical protein
LADMLIREASKELREHMFDESSEDEDGGGVGKGGGERVVGGKSKGKGGREGGGGRKKSRIPDSDEDDEDEDEGVVVTIRTKDKKLSVFMIPPPSTPCGEVNDGNCRERATGAVTSIKLQQPDLACFNLTNLFRFVPDEMLALRRQVKGPVQRNEPLSG